MIECLILFWTWSKTPKIVSHESSLLKYLKLITVFSSHRIEGNQMEDREGHKMWLVRHLEVTRQIMVDDLKVAKVINA